MSASETKNHYQSLKDLIPQLRPGNGVEVQITQEIEGNGPRVEIVTLESIVVAIGRGAMLGGPGIHTRVATFTLPLNPERRERGELTQTVWVERMTAEAQGENHADLYPKARIVKKAV